MSLAYWQHVWEECAQVTRANGLNASQWFCPSMIEVYKSDSYYYDTISSDLPLVGIERLIRDALAHPEFESIDILSVVMLSAEF